MLLGQFFVKNAKNDPRKLFDRPKSEKNENRKNAEIAENRVKVAVFDLLNAKTRTFSKILT